MEDTTYLVLTIIALLFLLFFNFTTASTGNITFVDAMNTYSKTILAGKGLFSKIGFYWLGVRPIHKIHYFKVVKEKENPEGDGPENWIKPGETVLVDSLRKVIPRPFVMKQVELADRTQVDLLVTVLLRAVNGEKFVYDLKADFLKIGATIRASVSDEVRKFADLADFIASDKSESTGFLHKLAEPDSAFNTKLKSYSDLELVSIEIPQFNADRAMLDAANKEAIAKREAAAITVLAEANAEKDRKLAAAEIEGIMQQLNLKGVSAETKLKVLETIIRMRSIKGSSLTTLVEGGGALPTISVK